MDMKKLSDKVNDFLRQEKNGKIIWGIVFAAVAGIILLSIPWGKEDDQPAPAQNVQTAQEDDLERRLEQVLGAVESAGRVKVLVTYASGPSIVPVMNTNRQENSTQGDASQDSGRVTQSSTQSDTPATVQTNQGSEPIIQVEYAPEVLGVLVIAEGADQLPVKLRLQTAVQTALQISADKIEVLPMQHEKDK